MVAKWNAVSSIKNFGTTSNYDLPLITNNTEKMRITADGRVGIGVTAPSNNLAVKDTIEIKRVGSISTLLFLILPVQATCALPVMAAIFFGKVVVAVLCKWVLIGVWY